MPKDIDESLIEATIRRVAEAQAARTVELDAKAEGDAAPDEVASDEPDDVASDEDAAHAPRALRSPHAADESLIEATIRRVAAAKVASEAHTSDELVSGNGAGAKRSGADESLIEATIRRVAEAKAASQIQPSTAPPDEHGDAVVGQQHGPSNAWSQMTERFEARLAQIEESVLSLTQRVEALEPLLEDQPAPLRPVAQAAGYGGHLAGVDSDDEWDDEPQPARMVVGLAPRPAIFRDAAPTTASAELEGEEPIAEPEGGHAPQANAKRADERRGLDLLPRTYRITVEDKRRGVDLVPLHRVLLALEGVRDMSLLSYNNGIAIVSLEVVTEIDLDALQQSVSRAMAREAKVEMHNENTIVIKLAEE